MGLSMNEQETCINYNRTSDRCTVWTSDLTVMTKLDKLVKDKECPDWQLIEENKIDGEVVAKKYETKKGFITYRSKDRIMSEEQKAAAAERIMVNRMKKNG